MAQVIDQYFRLYIIIHADLISRVQPGTWLHIYSGGTNPMASTPPNPAPNEINDNIPINFKTTGLWQ